MQCGTKTTLASVRRRVGCCVPVVGFILISLSPSRYVLLQSVPLLTYIALDWSIAHFNDLGRFFKIIWKLNLHIAGLCGSTITIRAVGDSVYQ